MKKIFIGCGVLALIVLGFLGIMVYQIAPVIMDFWDALEGMGIELVELEEQFPFDEEEVEQLDRPRFISALEFRRELVEKLDLMQVDLVELNQLIEEEDRSIFELGDIAQDLWLKIGPVIDELPGMLRQHEMASSELGWHTRVMWSTLKLIDAGVGSEDMEPLRGQFTKFRTAYEELKKRNNNNDLPPLDDVLGQFDEVILAEAMAVLAEEPQLVLEGIKDPTLEITYLATLTQAIDEDEDEDDEGIIRVRVNGKDFLDDGSEDSAPPADG